MNYHEYYPTDLVNGPGVRSTLFVSGCTHACEGCYNESTWNPKSGSEFTQELEDRIIADLQSTEIPRQGLSLSGGDPLHPKNLLAVLKLIGRVRRECPGKDIWLWTGFTLKEIEDGYYHDVMNPTLQSNHMGLRMTVLGMVDVFIDGKFVQELHDPKLRYRGSSNQKIIEVNNGEFTEVEVCA